jgi:pimeloyl-ACP methyl ester carboxylesterase
VAVAAVVPVTAVVVTALATRSAVAPRSTLAQGRPGPVVLVPGYGGGTDSLTAFAARLRAAGHTTTVLHLVGDGTGDLRIQAQLLKRTVDGLLGRGAPSVDVVGYSAGGIVTRLWAAELGGAAHARRIVLLGSPNHGTRLAGLAAEFGAGLCPAACRQLVPGSDVLRSLGDAGTPPGPGWVSVWTDQDQVVTPPDSARLDGAVDLTVQSVCSGDRVDHGGLPTDPVVEGIVVRALATAPFRVPGAADCAAITS